MLRHLNRTSEIDLGTYYYYDDFAPDEELVEAELSKELLPANATDADEHWLSDPCVAFNFFFNSVFLGTCCLFGVTTNLLSVVVLRRDKHHRVATFLLQSLAVADTAVLAVTFLVLSVFLGSASIPGVYVGYTHFAIPYLKKVTHDKMTISHRHTVGVVRNCGRKTPTNEGSAKMVMIYGSQ